VSQCLGGENWWALKLKPVRKRWQQIRAAIGRRVHYRITRGGALFVAAILAVGAGAIVTANNLLFLIVAAMLATLLISGLVTRLCLASLELDFLAPEHIPARRHVPGRVFVRNRKWLMPSFSIRVEAIRDPAGASLRSGVYFPLLAGGATLDAPVEALFPRRGAYKSTGFAFSTSFPFGFLERRADVTLSRETIVYPCVDPRPGFDDLLLGVSGEIETHYRGLGKDFYRIRPYEVLESARHVDWKATAHVGSLQVREFAREEEQAVELFLDRDVPYTLDHWFEHAVDCCAFLAWHLSNQGIAIHFRSQGFEFRQPEDGEIYSILKYLALVYPQRMTHAEGPRDESSYKVVITPSPRRFIEAGWLGARFVGPEGLAADAAPVDPGAAGAL
jgi:uncharacterized protein (DUF58 family)